MPVQLAPQFTQRPSRWTDWKSQNATKGGQYQSDDDGDTYTVWFYDGPEVHLCTIWKELVPDGVLASGYSQAENDADRADFEANYLSSSNGVISPRANGGSTVVTQSPYAYSEERTRFVGHLYSCDPGTTVHDEVTTKTIRLQGGYYWVRGATVGDRITFSVVDVNNVLGYGAGFVVAEYVKRLPVAPWDNQQEIIAPTAGNIPTGLFLRLTYENQGSSPVNLGVTYRWFEST